METDLNKVQSSEVHLYSKESSSHLPSVKGENQAKNLKNQAVYTKKTNEYGVVELLYHKKECKEPKSIQVHNFTVSGKKQALPSLFAKSGALFLKYVKKQAEILDNQIKTEREQTHRKKAWQEAKQAFNDKLEAINLAKKKKSSPN